MLRLFTTFLLVLCFAVPCRGQGDCPPEWSPAFPYDTTIFPFANKCLDLPLGTIHYIDESPTGTQVGTALLLHGNPTWSFVYRDIGQGLLDAGFRVIAPDYYGFGLSDKPSTDEFAFTPESHSFIMEDFVDALDLQDVTLVMQDWGGSVGLGLADRQPDRFSGFVIMNTLVKRLDPDDPQETHYAVDYGLDNIARETFYRETGTLPRGTGDRLGRLFGDPGSPEYLAVRNAYWGPFLDLNTGVPLTDDIVAPSNIFAQNLILSGDYLATVDDAIQNRLNTKPAYIIYGGVDPFFGGTRCDENRLPACPPGTDCQSLPNGDYCLLPDGSLIYPYIVSLRNRWGDDELIGEIISLTGGHFVQEYETDRIVAATIAVASAAQGGLRITPPSPGIAGQTNSVTASGATPGSRVFFFYGTATGQTGHPACPGLTLGLDLPQIAGSGFADSAGNVVIRSFVPSSASGLEILLQAAAPGSCSLSNLRRTVLQ